MKLNKAAQAKIGKVMGEYKKGELHSGGKVVTNPKQAQAISISEAAKLMKKKIK